MPRFDTVFTDVEFMTAKEKELVLKQWRTFLKHGCKWEHFTTRLYDHLIQHCSFIAHYNRHGFYDVYFTSVDGRRKFFSQFDLNQGGASVEYGGISWRTREEYADINGEMCRHYMPAPDPFVLKLQECGVDEEMLDSLVLDLKTEEATVINNGGMERQLEYIMKVIGSEQDILSFFCIKEVNNG